MDLSLTEAEQDLVELCRDFAQKEIATRAPAGVGGGPLPHRPAPRDGRSSGLLGMLVPEEWGGIGMSTIGFVAAMEQIGLADQSVAAAWQAHVTIGSLPLLLFGNDEQRERWLRPLAEGRALGAFGLTEPDAGSDARGIRTRAERKDGGWLINGRKTFISNAGTDMSFGVTLLARVDGADGDSPPTPPSSSRRTRPGFTMGPKMRGIGWRGLDTRELYFDDVWVPDEHLVGDPNLGPRPVPAHARGGPHLHRRAVAQPHPGRARPGHRLRQGAGAVRPADLEVPGRAVQAGRHRHRAGGGPLAHLPRRATCATPGSRSMKEAAMAKLKASRLATWAASEAVQIHGGLGYMLETPVARFYCDSKVLEIGEGTNEIQHLVIARALGC